MTFVGEERGRERNVFSPRWQSDGKAGYSMVSPLRCSKENVSPATEEFEIQHPLVKMLLIRREALTTMLSFGVVGILCSALLE